MYVCMYVCMYTCVYVCMYVSQGDFRLMSFTAGRCGTALIVCVSKCVSKSRPFAER